MNQHPIHQEQPAPTPQEIQQRAAMIRAEWSEAEHRRRASVENYQRWYPPGVVYRVQTPAVSIQRSGAGIQ
jgi:hypothetical protein